MSDPLKVTTLGDLLKGTPFDKAFDLGGTLTEKVFFDDFYVEPPALKDFNRELKKKLDSPYLTHLVTLISGYSGNGKTTFLKAFQRNHPEYKHEYYAAFQWNKTQSGRGSSSDKVTAMMQRQIRDSRGVEETLAFVAGNRDALKREDFISQHLHRFLEENPTDVYDAAFVERCTDEFQLEDAFAVMFVHLFHHSGPGRKTIVYFDNLDIAGIEYIVSDFWEHFHYSLSVAERLATDTIFGGRIDFRNDFRFVFCLRDMNAAVLNSHLAGRLDIARLQFTVPFDDEFYPRILDRRLRYLEEHHADRNLIPAGEFGGMMRAVVKVKDEYFNSVFMRLFNCDYRAAVTAILDVLTGLKAPPRLDVDYGFRGIILFGLLNRLFTVDFLSDYWEHSRRTEGWCYIDRVMLTVLINRSGYRRGLNEPDGSRLYGLYNLVQDLQPIYDLESIIESVARCFLNHRDGKVHLVTAHLDDQDAFVTVTKLVNRFKQVERDPDDAASRNKLNSILVRVNPAGFTLVRFILNHYEFYAHLVHHSESLFEEPLVGRMNDDKFAYRFETKIDRVLSQVEEHAIIMRKFFNSHYSRLRLNGENFPRSPYCFRHQGRRRVAGTVGQSHTISVITSHIDYIDHFRLHLVGKKGLLADNEEEAERVNQLLCDRLDKYVLLLAEAPDQAEATRLADSFISDIHKIRKNRDHTTEIRKDRDVTI